MEHKAITWVIACDSSETLRKAEQLANRESDPDRIFVDVAIAFPEGVEQRVTHHHRLGDYFERVQIVASDRHHLRVLTLVFQPRQGAKRYWKDMMVQIIGSISREFTGVSIEVGDLYTVSALRNNQ